MPDYFRSVPYFLIILYLSTGTLLSQQSNCINFDSLSVDTNYVSPDQSISHFYTERNVRFLTSNAIGTNDSIYGTIGSGCAQPNVTMGAYLFLKGAVKVDFTYLDTLPNLIVFSVNAQCNQTYFYATNNGEIQSVRATQNSHVESSSGVTTSYSEGTFIIQGPIYSFTFGGVGVGIDLICYEITPANCLFENLTIEKKACLNDSFELDLSFLKKPTLDSGFAIYINDSFQGIYNYDSLLYKLGPVPANCDTTYNILLVDQLDTLCKALYIFENTCCKECAISNLDIHIENCLRDSFYRVEISLDYSGSVSDRFNIYTKNNLFIGSFKYTSLPLLFDKFPISGDTVEYIRICDRNMEKCCVELAFKPLQCPPKCEITNVVATFLNCDSDSSYTVKIDFNDQSAIHSGYDVFSQNGYHETKFTNPPFTLMNFPISGAVNDQIKVCLNDRPDCCAMVELESPNCASSKVGNNFIFDHYEIIVGNSVLSFREKSPSTHLISSYHIYDLNGRSIIANKESYEQIKDLIIPTHSLKTGMYFLLLQDNNSRFHYFKFFKS